MTFNEVEVGFNVIEPLVLMHGRPRDKNSTDIEVNPMENSNIGECAELCKNVLGLDRIQALCHVRKYSSVFVALRGQKIVAYTTAIDCWHANHSVALTDEDMSILFLGAASICKSPMSFFIPTRFAYFIS